MRETLLLCARRNFYVFVPLRYMNISVVCTYEGVFRYVENAFLLCKQNSEQENNLRHDWEQYFISVFQWTALQEMPGSVIKTEYIVWATPKTVRLSVAFVPVSFACLADMFLKYINQA